MQDILFDNNQVSWSSRLSLYFSCFAVLNTVKLFDRGGLRERHGYQFPFFQILAVGADPILNRFDMNGAILSQIQCAPSSAFSVSLHQAGVCSDPKSFCH